MVARRHQPDHPPAAAHDHARSRQIIQVSTTQLTLREPDGTQPVIPLTPQTLVVILGQPATILDLRRKEQAMTMRIDGGPAVRIRVTSRG